MADREEPEIRDKAKKQNLQDTAERYALKPIAYGFFGGFLYFSQSHGLIVNVMVRVNRRSLRKKWTVYFQNNMIHVTGTL